MFTGITSDIGEVLALEPLGSGRRLTIATAYDTETIAIGASIACSGPCLTVVQRGSAGNRSTFDVDASAETLARTTLGAWQEGGRVNLERALKLGDELGGHLVTGHVDGVARILDRQDDGDMACFVLDAPQALARYIAEKGSVCLDGVSLTVNNVADSRFEVMIVPHTLAVTTWRERQPNDFVNLEVDMFARYLERMRQRG